LDSTAARQWALKYIPPIVREALLHQAASTDELNDNSVVKFWTILYSSQLHHVTIPSYLDEKSRQTLVQYLGSGLEKARHVIPTLIFRVAGAHTVKELDAEAKFLQKTTYLTIFVHRKGADDHLLKVLGQNCPLLQVYIMS
jgi:hypothetical protein